MDSTTKQQIKWELLSIRETVLGLLKEFTVGEMRSLFSMAETEYFRGHRAGAFSDKLALINEELRKKDKYDDCDIDV